MRNTRLAAAAALALALPASAQEEPQGAPSPNEIVNMAIPEEWIEIPAEDLLVMTLAPDADGRPREVVIQLMPAPFSQGWVENIRTLARAQWYDGISVNRVQDNYVVQWGDPGYDNPESGEIEQKPLPEGLRVMGEDEYLVDENALGDADMMLDTPEDVRREMGSFAFMWAADSALGAVLSRSDLSEAEKEAAIQEYLKMTEGVSVAGPHNDGGKSAHDIAMISINATATPTAPEGWHQRDSYAEWVEFWRGWPIGNYQVGPWRDENDNEIDAPMMQSKEIRERGYYRDVSESFFWPIHCYGMVGVGRNYSPDTGSGAELYTVIGHAPRHLDRNIALVGRIISGMEHLSSLPRGSGALGFYTEEEADKRTPILSVRVAADLPEEERPLYEYLSTDGETFARYAESRANRRDPFFIVPAGGADICNIPVPVRAFEYARDDEE